MTVKKLGCHAWPSTTFSHFLAAHHPIRALQFLHRCKWYSHYCKKAHKRHHNKQAFKHDPSTEKEKVLQPTNTDCVYRYQCKNWRTLNMTISKLAWSLQWWNSDWGEDNWWRASAYVWITNTRYLDIMHKYLWKLYRGDGKDWPVAGSGGLQFNTAIDNTRIFCPSPSKWSIL